MNRYLDDILPIQNQQTYIIGNIIYYTRSLIAYFHPNT